MSLDITLSEVQPVTQRARFYKDGEKPYVEISFIGSKDTHISDVKPEHMANFRAEWDAFCDGSPLKKRDGTPLTDLVTEQRAETYFGRNIHNLEELSFLSDGQCQALGHGTLTDRENARKLLGQRAMSAKEQAHKRAVDMTAAAKPASDAPQPNADLSEVNAKLDKLSDGIGALVGLLTAQAQKSKPGRKPKEPASE